MNKVAKNKAFYWKNFYKRNRHYHDDIKKLALSLVPLDASVLLIGSKGGEILNSLPNKIKFGIETDKSLLDYSKSRFKRLKIFPNFESLAKKTKEKFDYVFVNHSLSETEDVQVMISSLGKFVHKDSRVIVSYFNYLWKPALDFIKFLNLRMPDFREPNWLSEEDIDNFFYLENFEKVKNGKRFIFPFFIGKISVFINKYVSQLPIFNGMCLTSFVVYRKKEIRKNLSVSIIIPARNEAGNMKGVIKKIPKLGKKVELIFVEGNSKDNTYSAISEEMRKYRGPVNTALYKQKGKGKGDAVRLGFSKAKNQLLMILDADLTVDPKELSKFYKAAIENKGDLIMGSRLIYPMEKMAMRTLNIIGNKLFSIAFSYLLGQKIKDTLCGTKVLLKSDYDKIAKNRKYFGDFDPFGDYDLIFGAAKLNMRIVEIPIRYKERIYGTTNISRFTHGWLLLKMCLFAAKRLKFV